MNIAFEPLAKTHFPLLLKWLTTPHVHSWWDKDLEWTADLIQKKYATYVNGYKLQDGESKIINAYIIYADITPIGYIQLYNAYDFPRGMQLLDLPENLAAFDIFIGEPDYLGKGIGSMAIELFLNQYCDSKYTHIFADPDIHNVAAIKAYTKAGFEVVKTNHATNELWMLKENI